MIFLSCYQHFTDTCPVKTTMENIVRLIKDDASVAAKTAAHRNDPQAGHKSACPLFAVAAVMEGGKSERHIVEMTGVSMVDVDHISQHTEQQVLRSHAPAGEACGFLTGVGEYLRYLR